MLSSGKNSVNLLYLDIEISKNKRVKERDEKNKITKYEMELSHQCQSQVIIIQTKRNIISVIFQNI